MKFLGFPGGVLKDGDNFGEKLKLLKDKAQITLVGTAEGQGLQTPKEKTVFEEDLTAAEKAKIYKEKAVEILPSGLTNLGNTCYMNSVVQVLNGVPEFKHDINKYVPGGASVGSNQMDSQFVLALKDVLSGLQTKGASGDDSAFTPYQFVTLLKARFPTFAQTQNNQPMQQDAEECLREMLNLFKNEVQSTGAASPDS